MRLGGCVAIELALGATAALAASAVGVWAANELSGQWQREARAAPPNIEKWDPDAVEAVEVDGTLPMEPVRGEVGLFHGIADEILLEPLRESPVKSVKFNRGGSSISLRIELENGSRAAFKPGQTNRQTIPRREVAAFRINRLLGLSSVQPAIGRRFRADEIFGKLRRDSRPYLPRLRAEIIVEDGWIIGEMSWWIPEIEVARVGKYQIDSTDGIVTWKRYLKAGAAVPHDQTAMIAQISNMLLFDFLINNSDRWSGRNAMASADGRTLYFMDNTLSFGPDQRGTSKVRGYFQRSQKFSRSMVAAVRRMTEQDVREALSTDLGPFDHLLSGEEIEALMARRAHALEYIDGLIEAHGEQAVLEFP